MWSGDQVSNSVNTCADCIEFGNSFGNYSRLKKCQYAIILDEKKNTEGALYIINPKKKKKKKKLLLPEYLDLAMKGCF